MILHRYPPLMAGTLLRRYKRFFADVELDDGEIVTAHCPNTGTMTCISTPGSRVHLSKSSDPARRLAYTWEMIAVNGTWVGVNTAVPNRIIYAGLVERAFTELGEYGPVRREVAYGSENSRVDFLLGAATAGPDLYLEVKSTTWAEGDLARFPDTVTTRGQKHLRELTRLCDQGGRAAILYFINRNDCTRFCPGDAADPLYGQLLRAGLARGLIVLPCRFEITPEAIRYLGTARLDLPSGKEAGPSPVS